MLCAVRLRLTAEAFARANLRTFSPAKHVLSKVEGTLAKGEKEKRSEPHHPAPCAGSVSFSMT